MKVGIIFGGRSCEHDISIITGISAVNAAAVRHDVTPIYISGTGEWFAGPSFDRIETFSKPKYKRKRVHLRPCDNALYTDGGRKVCDLDVVIICTHGANGEDGALAGLLNLSGIPYAGSDILASAVGMDKGTQKRLYRDDGLTITPFAELNYWEMSHDKSGNFFEGIEKLRQLKFPLFVKPSGLGSSIGIGKAADFKELFMRLDEGFEWDNKVVIEEALENFIEVNCAVLGYGDKLLASTVEQPLSEGFLSYDDKYMSAPVKGATGRYMPAHIDEAMTARVTQTAKRVFALLGCAGIARIDFLIKGDDLYVNEINTVPGSLSSYLFSFDGMEFPALIDKLIETALFVHKQKARLRYSYNSDVLKMSIKK